MEKRDLNNQEKTTDILANRMLPKRDFEKVIEHDKTYANSLNQHIEFLTIKHDILGKRSQEVLQKQTRELIVKNIDTLCDWTESHIQLLDYTAKQRIQQKLVDDKVNHFENVFLPQYNKEIKESEENFNTTLKLAQDRADKKEKGFEELLSKINMELTWWGKVDLKTKANEEIKLQLYKPLKRLNSAYDRLEKENENAKTNS